MLKRRDNMWLSECCGEEPNHMFSMSGSPDIGFIGLCSGCSDHAEFKEYEEDYDG
tara:strand:- start:1819 stop:1983 length:165 start_codon:yes stop_codon:yes gene_type:complete